jgi:hypothetical protein
VGVYDLTAVVGIPCDNHVTTAGIPYGCIEEKSKEEISNISSPPSGDGVSADKKQARDYEQDFELIWEQIPKKTNKATAYDIYRSWLRGKKIHGKRIALTNRQMFEATVNFAEHIERQGVEYQYIKNADSFFRHIRDYIGQEGEDE